MVVDSVLLQTPKSLEFLNHLYQGLVSLLKLQEERETFNKQIHKVNAVFNLLRCFSTLQEYLLGLGCWLSDRMLG